MGKAIYTAAERGEMERKENAKAAARDSLRSAPKAKRGEAIEPHPAAMLFPAISGEPYAALVADIKTNGLREELVRVKDGEQWLLLDGRNRLRACTDAGVAPRWRDFGSKPGDGTDPRAFAISENVRRRHLDESQRSMIAARMATLAVGRPSDNAQICAISQEDAAALLQVARRSVQHAKSVLDVEDDHPDLVRVVDEGRLAVSNAAKLVKRPDRDDVLAVADLRHAENPKKAIAEAAKKLRENDASASEAATSRTSGRGKPEWLNRNARQHDGTPAERSSPYSSSPISFASARRSALGSRSVAHPSLAASSAAITGSGCNGSSQRSASGDTW